MSATPPVSRDGFSYANDSFYAETSNNQNRHRRATIPELHALFHPSGSMSRQDKEPVGHWYEAQLLHYGLTPSKNKAVAKSRLLDAVNKEGGLVVPERVRRLEGDLRKEWVKRDREAKKRERGEQGKITSSVSKAKRKRDSDQDLGDRGFNVNVSVNIGRNGLSGSESVSNPKRPKQTAKYSGPPRGGASVRGRNSPKLKVESTSTSTPGRQKQTARYSGPPRGGAAVRGKGTTHLSQGLNGMGISANISAEVGKDLPEAETNSTPNRPKQYARYSGPPRGGSAARGKSTNNSSQSRGEVRANSAKASEKTSPSVPRPRQTARRGGGLPAIRRNDDIGEESSEDEPPRYSDLYPESGDTEATDPDDEPDLGPLGLINGRYTVDAPSLDDWEMFHGEEFSLILCLEGSSIWGAYDFGMHSGIIHLPTRPWSSSYDLVPFSWRGRENSEGQMSFGSNNQGWIQFLGNGRIKGMINCYGKAEFTGIRDSGGVTRAPRDARSMRSEWDGYNAREYERENRARWGGSSWY
ncbi:MAG: hypothetical protein Q9227_008910 [Pyrenula ochraceoflavens]